MRARICKALCFTLTVISLSGCSKKETDIEEVRPDYLTTTTAEFTCYGDNISYTVSEPEVFQTVTDTTWVVLPSKDEFNSVTVEYIQGNSLNNYPLAYYEGISEEGKSSFYDNQFTTTSSYYGFVRTDKNNYILVTAPVELTEYSERLLKNIGGTDENSQSNQCSLCSVYHV